MGAHLIVEPNILLHAPTKMLFGGVVFSVSLLPFEGGKESLSHGVIQWPGRCRERLSEGRPHLQFLLDSESFDYSQVDFSNYMWENFARHEKYMSCFIAHKDAIIPIIQNRIKSEEASETEKRILYGFLLSGNEIWKI